MNEILITRIDNDLAQQPHILKDISKSFAEKRYPFPAGIASGILNAIASDTDEMYYLIHETDMNVNYGVIRISFIDLLSKRCYINLLKKSTDKLDIFENSIKYINNLLRLNFGITRLISHINETDLDNKTIFKNIGFNKEGSIPSYGWDKMGQFSLEIYSLNLIDRNNI